MSAIATEHVLVQDPHDGRLEERMMVSTHCLHGAPRAYGHVGDPAQIDRHEHPGEQLRSPVPPSSRHALTTPARHHPPPSVTLLPDKEHESDPLDVFPPVPASRSRVTGSLPSMLGSDRHHEPAAAPRRGCIPPAKRRSCESKVVAGARLLCKVLATRSQDARSPDRAIVLPCPPCRSSFAGFTSSPPSPGSGGCCSSR